MPHNSKLLLAHIPHGALEILAVLVSLGMYFGLPLISLDRLVLV
jgi:hypothetical protein